MTIRLRGALNPCAGPLVEWRRMPSVVILGGGPAGNTCASVAATLGADVTLVERDIVGGAAHLWDCIPSKALIATGGELLELGRARTRWASTPRATSTSRRCASGWRRSRAVSTRRSPRSLDVAAGAG